MQLGFYFDQNRCSGCFTCVVACKDWHDIPAGPAAWRRVTTIEKGRFPELFVAHLSTSCYHCEQPACVAACPVGAIVKRDTDGVVLVDRGACLGHDHCDTCLQVCPYQGPQFGAEGNAKMQMCDFCSDRLALGQQPACVASCPTVALDSGPINELRQKYGVANRAEGFDYDAKLRPSVVVNPMVDKRLLPVIRVDVAPAETITARQGVNQ